MNPVLRAWILDGTTPPDDFDLQAALAQSPLAQTVLDDLQALETCAQNLEELSPPPALDQAILTAVQNDSQRSAVTTLPPVPVAANRSLRQFVFYGSAVVALAAALLMAVFLPGNTVTPGDPENMTERGLSPGLGPEVYMELAVEQPNGDVQRFQQRKQYTQGATLYFQVKSQSKGPVHLIRVDPDGSQILHSQLLGAGNQKLQTPQGTVGYELENGEMAAVYAIVRFEREVDLERLVEQLPNTDQPDEVCIAVRALGGRCSAQRIEAVQ